MKLDELLKKITPLPWNENTPFAATGQQYWNDQKYRHHAANHLPALVDALRKIAALQDGNARLLEGGCQKIAQKALADAEKVK